VTTNSRDIGTYTVRESDSGEVKEESLWTENKSESVNHRNGKENFECNQV
jgi:hypothetical protein